MAAAANLIIPLPFAFLTILFTGLILTLEIFTSYPVYARILKWLTISLFAYLLTAVIITQPWVEVIKATFIPNFELSFAFFFIITGVLGTTISPYMFFWQASEEVEEEISDGILSKQGGIPKINKSFMRNLKIDNALGMFLSEVATWSIIVTTATVLHTHGVTDIKTAADAAKALEPLVNTFPNAGFIAKAIFAIGVIGLGLLGIPVLAGSASYALSEAFNWHEGLYRKLRQAHGFYGAITIATIIGLLINFVGIDPIKALIYSAVFNGIAAVPLIFLIARIGNNKRIMGEYKNGKLSNTIIWITFLAMFGAAIALFYTVFNR